MDATCVKVAREEVIIAGVWTVMLMSLGRVSASINLIVVVPMLLKVELSHILCLNASHHCLCHVTLCVTHDQGRAFGYQHSKLFGSTKVNVLEPLHRGSAKADLGDTQDRYGPGATHVPLAHHPAFTTDVGI